MKTTVDLPDEPVRALKQRTVMQGCTLRDLAADFIHQGLGLAAPPPVPGYLFDTGAWLAATYERYPSHIIAKRALQ